MFNIVKNKIQHLHSTHYIVITLAIVLQIQVTLFSKGEYLGLRIGLGDLLLPIIGILVLISLFKKKSYWPKWFVRHMMLWPIALILVMSISLLNGYFQNGYLSNWALINKYIGFLILISYFILGGWIITNAPNIRHILSLYMSVFSSFFILTIFASMVGLFLQYIMPFPLWLSDYPWDGFMANRNAFVVMFVLTFSFIIWGKGNQKNIAPEWIYKIFWLCLPVFFIFNESRTGWLAFIALTIIFLLNEPIKRLKIIAPLLLTGCLITFSSYYITTETTSSVLHMRNISYTPLPPDNDNYETDQERFIAIEDGLELYNKSNFLLGAGLGTYKPFQIEKRGKFINIIDFTGLWLLVETGALGLFIFASFFMTCIWSSYQAGFKEEGRAYHKAIFTFLILFAAMSILHELMYSRILWFSVGLAMGVPIAERRRID